MSGEISGDFRRFIRWFTSKGVPDSKDTLAFLPASPSPALKDIATSPASVGLGELEEPRQTLE